MDTVTTTTPFFVGNDGERYKAATNITLDPTGVALKFPENPTTTETAILHCVNVLSEKEDSDYNSVLTDLEVMAALHKIWCSIADFDADLCHALVDTKLGSDPQVRQMLRQDAVLRKLKSFLEHDPDHVLRPL
jgi:hypothetical protein